VAWIATHQSGTTPRLSSAPVSASITGIELVSTQPAPSTTPLPTALNRSACVVRAAATFALFCDATVHVGCVPWM
jgi:hypothetical protein